MTKMIVMVLVLAIVICSVFGWSCSELNYKLINASDIIIKLQDKALSLLEVLPGFGDNFLSGSYIDTGDNIYSDNDKYNFIEYSHSECIISLINNNLDIVDTPETKSLIKPDVYSIEIKTNKKYYTCYSMCYNFSDMVYYVIVNAPYEASHLINTYFVQGAFRTLTFYSPYSIRLYRNLVKTDYTLSEIDHTCILTGATQ